MSNARIRRSILAFAERMEKEAAVGNDKWWNTDTEESNFMSLLMRVADYGKNMKTGSTKLKAELAVGIAFWAWALADSKMEYGGHTILPSMTAEVGKALEEVYRAIVVQRRIAGKDGLVMCMMCAFTAHPSVRFTHYDGCAMKVIEDLLRQAGGVQGDDNSFLVDSL